ncbi:MAG: thiosulfate oxidation carrier complex protein SoxZ [Pseudomonadota bacterium]
MATRKPRIKIPKSARIGETITIKTMIAHPMETGHRLDRATGQAAPRKIIHRFRAYFDGETLVDVDINPGVAANPYFKFQMRVPGAGTLRFEWVDDDGAIYAEERPLNVA